MFAIQLLANSLRPVGRQSIFTTARVFAEPPKKKRRLEPALLKIRVERKIKKCEREIRRIESEPRHQIPILEYNYPPTELRNIKSRPKHSVEDPARLDKSLKAAQKLWGMYRLEQSKIERASIKQVEAAQQKALNILQKANKKLYDATTEVDDITLIPFTPDYMKRDSCPNADYTPPDGYIKDISPEYVR